MGSALRKRRRYKRKLINAYGISFRLNIKAKKIIILFVLASFLIISILLLFRYSSYGIYSTIEEYISQKEYYRSLELIEGLLREDVDDYTALKQKGRVYSILAIEEDIASYDYKSEVIPKEALAIYRKLVSMGGEGVGSEVYFFMGLNLFFLGKGEYLRSLEFIEKAISLNSVDEEIEAYISGKEGLVLNISNERYYFTLNGLCGYLSFQTGNYEKGVFYFRKALLEESAELIYNLYLGLCYFNLKEFAKAESSFLLIAESEERKDILEHSYFLLSNIAFNDKRYSESEAYIRRAIDLRPSTDSYYQIGLIYERKRDIKTAFGFWTKALELDPGNSKARQRVIRFEKKLKKRKR